VKTVLKMLLHSDVATTLGIYAHSMSKDRLAAQDDREPFMLEMQTRAVLYLFQLECDNTVASSPREGQQLRRFYLQNLTWNNSTKAAAWFCSKLEPVANSGLEIALHEPVL
jgi:hypothetical protein